METALQEGLEAVKELRTAEQNEKPLFGQNQPKDPKVAKEGARPEQVVSGTAVPPPAYPCTCFTRSVLRSTLCLFRQQDNTWPA